MEVQNNTISYTLVSPEIQSLCASDERLSLLIQRYGQLSYQTHSDAFTFMVKTVIGQMLSSKAADAISGRLEIACNKQITPETILSIDKPIMKQIGLSKQKVECISRIASLAVTQPHFFSELRNASDEDVINRLTKINGIGAWSAKMYLIFVLNRIDVLPYEDGAFLQSYKWLYKTNDLKPASVIQRCAPWKPYSSLAARYLYRALDEDLLNDKVLNMNLKASPVS